MHQILFLGLFLLRTTQVLFNIFGKAQTLEDFLYHNCVKSFVNDSLTMTHWLHRLMG